MNCIKTPLSCWLPSRQLFTYKTITIGWELDFSMKGFQASIFGQSIAYDIALGYGVLLGIKHAPRHSPIGKY
jgi:hypothetical protein